MCTTFDFNLNEFSYEPHRKTTSMHHDEQLQPGEVVGNLWRTCMMTNQTRHWNLLILPSTWLWRLILACPNTQCCQKLPVLSSSREWSGRIAQRESPTFLFWLCHCSLDFVNRNDWGYCFRARQQVVHDFQHPRCLGRRFGVWSQGPCAQLLTVFGQSKSFICFILVCSCYVGYTTRFSMWSHTEPVRPDNH